MYSKLVSGCGGFFLKVNKQPEIYPSHYRIEGNEFTREMKPKHQKWDLDPQNRKQRDRVCCGDRHLFQQWQQGHQPSERDLWRTARKTKHATASPKPVGKKAVSIQNRTTISPSKSHWFFSLREKTWPNRRSSDVCCCLSSCHGWEHLVFTWAHSVSVYCLVKWDISVLLIMNIWLERRPACVTPYMASALVQWWK